MIAITNSTLIDGTGSDPLLNKTVIVNGDKIEAVEPEDNIEFTPEIEIIDATGMVLLPGLIDCHDHLASVGYDIASRWGITEPRSLRTLRIASVLRQTLETGYTTVRDAGGLPTGHSRVRCRSGSREQSS